MSREKPATRSRPWNGVRLRGPILCPRCRGRLLLLASEIEMLGRRTMPRPRTRYLRHAWACVPCRMAVVFQRWPARGVVVHGEKPPAPARPRPSVDAVLARMFKGAR